MGSAGFSVVLRRTVVWILLLPIHVYRLFISPLLPRNCRFEPTCSAYALEALRLHGPLRGGYFALRRILRCHPWGKSGYDPVPDKAEACCPSSKEKKKARGPFPV